MQLTSQNYPKVTAMSFQLPPVPDHDVPVLVETSNSHNYGPEHHGIDIATQWWCEAVRRPRHGDVCVSVHAPGANRYEALLTLTLPADDLDETESAGHHAIRIARPLARLVGGHDSDDAVFAELRELLSPEGPLGDHSAAGWHRLLHEWLPDARAARSIDELPPLELQGNVVPDDLWTVSMVAKYLGYTGKSANGSARKWLSRQEVRSEGRKAGRGGESLYPARLVRAAKERSPGKGRRGAARQNGQFVRPEES